LLLPCISLPPLCGMGVLRGSRVYFPLFPISLDSILFPPSRIDDFFLFPLLSCWTRTSPFLPQPLHIRPFFITCRFPETKVRPFPFFSLSLNIFLFFPIGRGTFPQPFFFPRDNPSFFFPLCWPAPFFQVIESRVFLERGQFSFKRAPGSPLSLFANPWRTDFFSPWWAPL